MLRITLPICLLFCAAPVSAQLQGTLFTSEEQRAYLDFLREEHLARTRERGFDIDEVVVPELPTEEAAPPPEPVIYRLGGIMSRRDGSYGIWLNGRSLDEGSLPDAARIVSDNGTLALRFSTPQGPVFLRPGQTLNFDRGEVLESYQANGAAAASTEVLENPAPAVEEVDAASNNTTPPLEVPAQDAEPVADTDPDILPDAEQLQALATEMNMSPEALQALLQDMQAAATRVATENGDGQ